MSARDLIAEMRNGTKPAPQPAGRFRALDLVIGVIAVAAVGALGYFATTSLMATRPPGPAPTETGRPAATAVRVDVAWTEADDARCEASARGAADDPVIPDGVMPPNRVVAEGIAGMATRLVCRLANKPERFCDPEQKAALVAMVRDYLTRADVVLAGLALQGAPMRVMGGLFGGEMGAGDTIYQMERESTEAVMRGYDDKVAAALRRLARDGLVGPSDFADFLGATPKNVERLFGDAMAQRQVCG